MTKLNKKGLMGTLKILIVMIFSIHSYDFGKP